MKDEIVINQKATCSDVMELEFEYTDASNPLRFWTSNIEQLTSVQKQELKLAYNLLVNKLDEACYKNKLKEDSNLLAK